MAGLNARGLCVRLGGTEILSGIDVTIAPGEVVGLIGPNGAGKSTLLRALAGLLPHRGEVAPSRGRGVGLLPQDNGAAAALTALEVVLLGDVGRLSAVLREEDIAHAVAALALLGVSHLAGRPIGEMSGGQRQLIFLAQVLAAEPGVILLDEPISALDPRNALSLLRLIRRLTRERGLATLICLHDLNAAARFCDRMIVLVDGRVRSTGSPDDILTGALLAEVYGIEVERLTSRDGCPIIVPIGVAET